MKKRVRKARKLALKMVNNVPVVEEIKKPKKRASKKKEA